MNEIILFLDSVNKTYQRVRHDISERRTFELFANREPGRHINENCELRIQHDELADKYIANGNQDVDPARTGFVQRRTLFALDINAHGCSGKLLAEDNKINKCEYREDCWLYKLFISR